MPLPANLESKYLARLDELIREGEAIKKAIRTEQGAFDPWFPENGEQVYYVVDFARFVKWRTNCASLLTQMVPAANVHRGASERFAAMSNTKDNVEYGTALLRALKEDYAQGFLGDLSMQIESEVAANYMGQAENLLQEGTAGKYDHVPAAVLCGAVLERSLRTLCERQTSPVPAKDAKGKPLMLNSLIDALKKTHLYNEAMAKQLGYSSGDTQLNY